MILPLLLNVNNIRCQFFGFASIMAFSSFFCHSPIPLKVQFPVSDLLSLSVSFFILMLDVVDLNEYNITNESGTQPCFHIGDICLPFHALIYMQVVCWYNKGVIYVKKFVPCFTKLSCTYKTYMVFVQKVLSRGNSIIIFTTWLFQAV